MQDWKYMTKSQQVEYALQDRQTQDQNSLIDWRPHMSDVQSRKPLKKPIIGASKVNKHTTLMPTKLIFCASAGCIQKPKKLN